MTTAVVMPNPTPDLAAAERFLTLLDEGAEFFTFQTFDDLATRKDRSLARILHGTLEQHATDLQRLQWRRAGVYVTANETDGKGRRLAHMIRPRAVWCEWDRAGESLPVWPLEPHIQVETSPGKFHFYWLAVDLTWEDFDAVMRVMVARYGSDPNARDRARVLRVPGFWHQKYETPFQVRIAAESLMPPYGRETLLAAFSADTLPDAAPARSDAVEAPSEGSDGHWLAIAARMAGEHAARTWADPRTGRHNQIISLGHELESRGVPSEFDRRALEFFASLMRPTNTAGAPAPINLDNEWAGLQHGRLMARDKPSVVHGAAVSARLLDRDKRDISLLVPMSRFIGEPAAPVWTVRHWLPAASLVVLFGEPGCGKSFLAVDWACSVAAGRDWNGNRVRRGAVVYLAGEGHYGLRLRFVAWQQRRGAVQDRFLHVSERPLTFDAGGAAAVFEAVAALAEIPALVIVDTMSSTMAGDENNGKDVNAFVGLLKQLMFATGATLVVVHHTGHADKTRARGWSGLKGHLDTEIRCERAEGTGTLTCTKFKDSKPPHPLSFDLTSVELPACWRDPDEPDEPVTSCVFDSIEGEGEEARAPQPSRLPAGQTLALRALEKALVERGGRYDGQFGARLDDWRQAAYAGGIADTPEGKKKAFQRARNALLASGCILCNHDIYWLADVGQQAAAVLLNAAECRKV